MDPKKRKRIDRSHEAWLRDDPLNKRLRAMIERYRVLSEARRERS